MASVTTLKFDGKLSDYCAEFNPNRKERLSKETWNQLFDSAVKGNAPGYILSLTLWRDTNQKVIVKLYDAALFVRKISTVLTHNEEKGLKFLKTKHFFIDCRTDLKVSNFHHSFVPDTITDISMSEFHIQTIIGKPSARMAKEVEKILPYLKMTLEQLAIEACNTGLVQADRGQFQFGVSEALWTLSKTAKKIKKLDLLEKAILWVEHAAQNWQHESLNILRVQIGEALIRLLGHQKSQFIPID